jgi:hypothetical protein
MIGWLWRVIVGRFSSCEHKFEVHQEIDVVSPYGGKWHAYDLRCEHCGKMKRFDSKSR